MRLYLTHLLEILTQTHVENSKDRTVDSGDQEQLKSTPNQHCNDFIRRYLNVA